MRTKEDIINLSEIYSIRVANEWKRKLDEKELQIEIKWAYEEGYQQAIKDCMEHFKDIFKDHNY